MQQLLLDERLAYWVRNRADDCWALQDEGPPLQPPLVAQRSKTEFEVRFGEDFTPIISSAEFILVHEDIVASLLKRVANQFLYYPVQLFRRGTGETWSHYCNLWPTNDLPYEDYHATLCEGMQLFRLRDRCLYASPALARKLKRDLKHLPDLVIKQGIATFEC